ncbi:unnamed protein product [Echinostoma caproni]|uniref:Uncharacterized protein n=1 Tax=Echinostoma caproni TaxID=27848 RepID=A0A183A5P5_9TREM|nr:unnamed protein product [Echinostoma caproni]
MFDWAHRIRHTPDDQSPNGPGSHNSRVTSSSDDPDRLSLTVGSNDGREKSSSPEMRSESQKRREQLQRGTSFSIAQFNAKREEKISLKGSIRSGSDREDKTPEREADGPWVKGFGVPERRRKMKL